MEFDLVRVVRLFAVDGELNVEGGEGEVYICRGEWRDEWWRLSV